MKLRLPRRKSRPRAAVVWPVQQLGLTNNVDHCNFTIHPRTGNAVAYGPVHPPVPWSLGPSNHLYASGTGGFSAQS